MTDTITRYMAENGMVVPESGLPSLHGAFAAELEAALAGEASSLMPLPSFLAPPAAIKQGKRVLAVDMGGTNLRSAEISFGADGIAAVGGIRRQSVSGAVMPAERFLAMLADVVSGSDCEDVGLCFSYQAEILPDRDARVISLSKELRVDGIEGVVLGKEINRILASRGLAPRRFTVLNDTTAVFLAACAKAERPSDVACSFIIGTGTNSAYPEAGQILNTESGCFAGFPRGRFDLLLDAQSAVPGDHQAEKMIGGRYLMRLTELCADAFRKELHSEADVTDAVRDVLYGRAALFVTAELAALLTRGGRGSAGRPAVICFEGSTYRLSSGLSGRISRCMEGYIRGRLGIEYTIIQTDNAGLAGAAAAALAEAVQ